MQAPIESLQDSSLTLRDLQHSSLTLRAIRVLASRIPSMTRSENLRIQESARLKIYAFKNLRAEACPRAVHGPSTFPDNEARAHFQSKPRFTQA